MPKFEFIESLENRTLFAGLSATYFDNANLTGKSVTRADSAINFSWPAEPIAGMGKDTFSVRWTGTVQPRHSQSYTFHLTSDDGIRLWVNHKLLIDRWTNHAKITDAASISLVSTKAYDIQVEYYDNTGGGTAKLEWSSRLQSREVISSKFNAAPQNLLSQLDHSLAFAGTQLKTTLNDLGNSTAKFVERTRNDGTWSVVTADAWVSGFLPASMWQMYAATGDTFWRDKATAWTKPLAGQVKQNGDLAFRLLTTYKPLYQITQTAADKKVLLDAAASKNKTWNENVGAFTTTWRRSNSGDPRADFGVLMDQTTDMELLIWASQNGGDPIYAQRAERHVQNVIDHLIRLDGGSYHWGYFSTADGEFISGETYQGFANESTWARGQAWGILSLSAIAGQTGSAATLAAAQKMADYFLANLPADSIPFWDFNHPNIPNTVRDSSAAAIAANGLLDLASLLTDAALKLKYKSAAEKILAALVSPTYAAENAKPRGLVQHASQNVPNDPQGYGNDVSLIYGDYYFLAAINKYRAMQL